MQQIDFYILNTTDIASSARFLGSLCQKAFNQQHTIDILTESAEQTKQVDHLLWTFSPQSFVPHHVDDAQPQRLLIRDINSLAKRAHLLLNLSPDLNSDFSQYQRILQCVFNCDRHKQQSRTLYKQLQAQGWQIKTHNITA